MAKKTISVKSTSMVSGTLYYTCPSNTIAKVISFQQENDGYMYSAPSASGATILGFRGAHINGVVSTRKDFYLADGEALLGNSATNGPWSMIIVEESLGVQ
tara:strand:+ start:158 stop:460 length:303 start_codon:yes stop_codon:yes gene_type:complete